MKENRCAYLDYAKMFAILFVVFIHIGFSELNNYVLFAMPLFFWIAGYTYNDTRKRTLKENVVDKFKKTLIPFWIFMIIYIIVELVRAPFMGYGDSKQAIPALINTVYGSGYIPNNSGVFDGIRGFMYYTDYSGPVVDLITPTNPHLWFLPAFFTACVIFYFIIAKKKITLTYFGLSVTILVFLSSLEAIIPQIKQLPYGLGRGFMGAAFMLVGFYMKKYNVFEKKKRFIIPAFALSFTVSVCSILLGSNGSAYVASYYGSYGMFSVFLTFMGGVGAVYCVVHICKLLECLPLPKLKNIMSLVGRNTMTIYTCHMLFKFIFDILYLKIFDITPYPDKFYMAFLPPNAWWYMILEGVAIIFICTTIGIYKKAYSKKSNRFILER